MLTYTRLACRSAEIHSEHATLGRRTDGRRHLRPPRPARQRLTTARVARGDVTLLCWRLVMQSPVRLPPPPGRQHQQQQQQLLHLVYTCCSIRTILPALAGRIASTSYCVIIDENTSGGGCAVVVLPHGPFHQPRASLPINPPPPKDRSTWTTDLYINTWREH